MIIKKYLLFLIFSPLIFFANFIYYFYPFKFCEINASRLGAATVYAEGFLFSKKYFSYEELNNCKIFFYFRQPINNNQIHIMIERSLHIYKPALFFFVIEKVLRLWNKNKFTLDFKNYSLKNTKLQSKINKIYKKPILFFLKNEILEAKELLNKIGIQKNDKWVCIHNRDSVYLDYEYPKKNWSFHTNRDFSVESLLSAAELFAQNGYYVLRMGKRQKHKLISKNSKIIDYSFSEIRCDLMDIYLLANCEFFFGGESGPSDISYTFCRPCYGINFPPTYFYESRAHLDSSFIFKRIKNLKNNQLLSLKNIFKNKNGQRLNNINMSDFDYNKANQENLKFIDNSEEDIRAFADEILRERMGEKIESNEDSINQKKFWEIYYNFNKGLFDNNLKQYVQLDKSIKPKVSPSFIRNNLDLLN